MYLMYVCLYVCVHLCLYVMYVCVYVLSHSWRTIYERGHASNLVPLVVPEAATSYKYTALNASLENI